MSKAPTSGHDPRPIVRLPRSGVPGVAIAGGAVLAAGLLFAVLDGQRRKEANETAIDSAAQVSAFPAPPPLAVPSEQPVPPAETPPVVLLAPPVPSTVVTRPVVSPSPPAPVIVAAPAQPVVLPSTPIVRERPSRTDAEPQALIIDGGVERQPAAAASTASQQRANNEQRNPLLQGPGLGSDTAPAQATTIRNQTMVMPTGTMIPAVMETPIDTARPGLVRAVVSVDTRGFDGRRVLVPRGSRLIGEYQAFVQSGQNRVLVNWTRLIRPDGVAIALSSPAADSLGGAGVPGKVHSFFLQRFGAALLQSALTVGVNLASRPGKGSVIVGLPTGQINNTIGQGLLPNDIRPKITVKQGADINVFVARDLDFSLASSAP